MQWSEVVEQHTQALVGLEKNMTNCQRVLRMLDLTSLNQSDTSATVAALCDKANTRLGSVAGICVLPQFVNQVAQRLQGSPSKAVTVVNFPEGNADLDATLFQINDVLEGGAQEVDVVFPYHRYLAGERQYAQTFIAMCKAACGNEAILKVILETGALNDTTIIADAGCDALTAGADFLKTSTGKFGEGATLNSVATLLLVVKHLTPQLKRPLGVKVSGGIKSLEQALRYVALADQIMGEHWAQPQYFRIGASQLIDDIIAEKV